MDGFVGTLEAAAHMGISQRRLQELLAQGRILGATQLGTGPRAPWVIPVPIVRIRADRGPRRRPGTRRRILER